MTKTEHTTQSLSPRDAIRAQVFNNTNKVKSELVEFFGTTIELRQPTLGGIVDARAKSDGNIAVIDTLVERAYVPGTDIRIFEEADADSLKILPFGADFLRVTEALTRLTEVNFLKPKALSDSTLGNT